MENFIFCVVHRIFRGALIRGKDLLKGGAY